uniref:Fungal lipase-type domain-containing protein n=1 Tax=Glycine max TaxID=3847 RepID=A0A0R0LCE1_SOYBN|eukprot:XP_014617415.1 uncharacterized protein LOC102666641 [Glycine max]
MFVCVHPRTRSIKDTLTDAIGAPVSFNHYICSDGELKRKNEVAGHAHRGMVAAAGWIKKHCTPILLDALRRYPDFEIKIVGHSLGGGTAALLTYMLREIKQFSSCTCVTFGPAACMTLGLAEFGKPFITSIINGFDMVPTLSACSVHDFISEGLIKRKKILNAARNAVVSRLPFASTAKAIAARGSQVVMKNKQRTRSLLPWSRRKNTEALASSKSENLAEACRSIETSCEFEVAEETSDEDDGSKSSSEESDDDEEEQILSATQNITNQNISEDELLNQVKGLELETEDDIPNTHAQEKEATTTKDFTTLNISEDDIPNIHAQEKEAATTKDINIHAKEKEIVDHVVDDEESGGSDNLGRHPLYPPGRVMHIVPALSSENSKSNHNDPDEKKQVFLYKTSTELYGKLRLSRGMLLDHYTSNYLKMLQQFIDQLEKEKFHYGG